MLVFGFILCYIGIKSGFRAFKYSVIVILCLLVSYCICRALNRLIRLLYLIIYIVVIWAYIVLSGCRSCTLTTGEPIKISL